MNSRTSISDAELRDALALHERVEASPQLHDVLDRIARSRPRPRGSTPAVRLLIAAVFVGLASGALLLASGGSPTPTPSPSPSATPWALPAALVTEPIEPGVVRVLSDGAGHDLDVPSSIAVGPDGGVWVAQGTVVYRLGLAGGSAPAPGVIVRLGMSPDGTLHAASASDQTMWVLDDGAWTAVALPPEESGRVIDHAVSRDGTVWVAFQEGEEEAPVAGLGRWDGRAWTLFDARAPLQGLRIDPNPYAQLRTTPDGTVWLVALDGADPPRGYLVRFDGRDWRTFEAPFPSKWFGTGEDGSVWILGGKAGGSRLARFDGSDFAEVQIPAEFDLDPGWGDWTEFRVPPVVASDGAVWLFRGGDGVVRFDGHGWSAYLHDDVGRILAGAAGSVWAINASGGPARLIRPGAS